MAPRCNEYAADLNARWPKRFGAFATVPLPGHPRLDRQLDGVCLFASYGDQYLGDRALDPLMEQLDARSAVVFVRPSMPLRRGTSTSPGRCS